MAFARAAAAGFDTDHMTHLIMFAECYGASRLKEACSRFMDLWKVKHESGQWFEVEAVEAMSTRSGFSLFNASGIVLVVDAIKEREFGEWPASGGDLGTESNGNDATTDHSSNKKLPSGPQVPSGPHHAQFQQPTFPPWAMHPPLGPPVYQPYPMQGMPYHPNYSGSGRFYQPPYPPSEDPWYNSYKRTGRRRHSLNSKDNDVDSESGEDDAEQSLLESEKDGSHGRKSHKWGGRSGKERSGMVIIRNINYVASEKHEKSGDESQLASEADTEDESEDSHSDTVERNHKKSSRSSKKNEVCEKSLELDAYNNDMVIHGNEADSGNWQTF